MLRPSQRSSSYDRLRAKLVRNPASYKEVNKKDWNRPQTPNEIAIHAIKGGASMIIFLMHFYFYF